MIIVRIQGGLGNQLQQYAMYRKFVHMGTSAKIDLSWFSEENQKKQYAPRKLELDLFEHLPYEACTKKEKEAFTGKENSIVAKIVKYLAPGKSKYFHENGRMYLPEVFQLQDAYLDGYWACESYYHDMLPALREEIIFPESSNKKNLECMEQMERENSVSIHIRRGDYLNPENAALFGNICTEAYYENAINTICGKIANPHFYIFSDDTNYAKEKYSTPEFTIVDWNKGKESFFDIALMNHCKHNICANSTFSFWGVRLNPNPEKIAIRPLKHRNNQQYDREKMEKLWPGYILLS